VNGIEIKTKGHKDTSCLAGHCPALFLAQDKQQKRQDAAVLQIPSYLTTALLNNHRLNNHRIKEPHHSIKSL
jgi:hypothetical protein